MVIGSYEEGRPGSFDASQFTPSYVDVNSSAVVERRVTIGHRDGKGRTPGMPPEPSWRVPLQSAAAGPRIGADEARSSARRRGARGRRSLDSEGLIYCS